MRKYPWEIPSRAPSQWALWTAIRWPRLFVRVKAQGVLSSYETACAIRALRDKHQPIPEAVSHYGGVHTLVRDAIKGRHHYVHTTPFRFSFPK